MPEAIIIGEKEIVVAALTKDEFIAMTDADKTKVLIAEKEAQLAEADLEKSKQAFFVAKKAELDAFDADAFIRIGNLQSQISQERTVIENKYKAAENAGTFVIPV